MRLGVNRAATMGFNDKVLHRNKFKIDWIFNFSQIFYWNADVPRYASPINFFKRKKRKKESQSTKWKVSKKQVFLKKYYPMRRYELKASCLNTMLLWNWKGGDFFKNPEGLNLLFWIPATYLCSLFFIFCFVTDCRLSKMVLGKGIKFWGQKKMKTNFIPMLFLNRNLILFLLLVLGVL